MTLQGKLNRLKTAIGRTRQRQAEIHRIQRQLDADLRHLAKRIRRHEAKSAELMQADAQMWFDIYMQKPSKSYTAEAEYNP